MPQGLPHDAVQPSKAEDKEKVLQVTRGKKPVAQDRVPTCLAGDWPAQSLVARWEGGDFPRTEGENWQPGVLPAAKPAVRHREGWRCSQGKLRECNTARPVQPAMFKGVLRTQKQRC